MNRITVTGNLGKDAELRYTPNGKAVLSVSIADSTGRDRPTIWWKAEVWLGDQDDPGVAGDLTKGTRVRLDGYVQQEEWTDRDGQTQRGLKLVSNLSDLALPVRARRTEEAPTPRPSRQESLPVGRPESHRAAPPAASSDDDDDVPF
jgi:single-strand DNA-binding protein